MQIEKAVPALPVSDLRLSTSFYRDVLGFEVIHDDGTFAVLRHGPIDLHLWLAGDSEWRTRPQNFPVVSGAESFLAGTGSCRFQVRDVAETFRRLEGHGVIHPNGALSDTAWGTTEFSLVDPDNNLVTMYEPIVQVGPH